MFAIIEGCIGGHLSAKTFPTFAEAVAFAKANYPIVYFEIDADHAEAADFVTEFGSVYAIQAI